MTENNSKVVFRDEAGASSVQKQVPESLQDIAKSSSIHYTDKKKQEQLVKILPNIQQWKISALRVDSSFTTIINTIQDVKFSKLTQIYIRTNQLATIQSLPRIWMPNVHTVSISDNKIRNISILKKADWPNFSYLYIYQNKIIEGKQLTNICSKVLKLINLQWSENELIQLNDIRFICKLEKKKKLQIDLKAKKRLSQSKISNGKFNIGLRT